MRMKSTFSKYMVLPFAAILVAVVMSQLPPCDDVSNPCLNGGNCNDGRCINCDNQYFGTRCQYKNTQTCNGDSDCRNGGDCRNNICVCRDFWYGQTCEQVCPGQPSICLNGGTCVEDPDRNDGFDCQCVGDITGRFCEMEEELECYPECLNGGTCEDTSTTESPICVCPEGFTGSQCEGGAPTSTPCSSDPCLNGGTCTNMPNNVFSCDCPVNYGGSRCMDFVPPPNPCGSNPCMNEGTCDVATTGTIAYSCVCAQGFTGTDCGITAPSLPCDSNPCANGGSCTSQDAASFTCNCATGFSGATCGVGGGGGGNTTTGPNAQTIIIIAAAGGFALIVLVIVLICIICLCFVRRRKPSQRSKKSKAKRMTTSAAADDHRRLRPNGNDKHHPENNYVAMTTKRKTMEFPRGNLRFLEHVGSGAFASVYKAEAYAILKPRKKTVVAVKALKENASENDRKDFMKELALFKALGKHENLVTMYGCCTEKDPVYLIMEYLSKGNLQQHLRSMVNGGGGGTYTNKMTDNQLSPSELLTFGIQISKGMEFLHSKQCVHRDLAARNILLDDDFVCKISDFGLARDVADSQEYEMKSKGRVPVRWMAPESLMQNLYTTKSDAWSFGIVMWEIITLGSHPYPGMSPRQVMQSVQNGYRLPQPDHCNDEIYGLLEKCWKEDPADRPSFTEIRMSLENMMEVDQGYLQMDNFQQDNYLYLSPDLALAEEL